jgi:hypothetical protein
LIIDKEGNFETIRICESEGVIEEMKKKWRRML